MFSDAGTVLNCRYFFIIEKYWLKKHWKYTLVLPQKLFSNFL